MATCCSVLVGKIIQIWNMMHWRETAHNFFCNTKQDIHSAAVGLPVPSTFTNAPCGITLPPAPLFVKSTCSVDIYQRALRNPLPLHSKSWRVPVPSISTSLSCGISAPRYLPAPCGNSHRFYPLQGNSLLKYATHLAPFPLVYFVSVQTSQHRSSRAIHVNIFHQSFAIDSKYSSLCCKSGPKAPLQRTYSWRGCRRET